MIPNADTISHAAILWILTVLSGGMLGVIGYMFKRMDNFKSELAASVPTKEEVKQIANSLNAIAQRLDSLYILLAQKAIDGIHE
jgi:hypothetical protein